MKNPTNLEPRFQVAAAMTLAITALSFASIFITKLEAEQVPPLIIAFYRMAMTTILLLAVSLAFKRKELASLGSRDLKMLSIGGLCLAIHFAAWIASLKYVSIATSVVLVNSHPLFVVIASYFFFGERPSRRRIVGTAVGLAGMFVISRDAFGGIQLALKGDGLALLGAFAVVGYFIVGRKARARISLLGYVTPVYAACSVILLMLAVGSRDSFYPYSSSAWAYLAALAVVPTVFGHTLFNWSIKHVRPTAISVTFLAEPVVASLLALIFFGQTPPLATFVGGPLVLAGVYLTTSK